MYPITATPEPTSIEILRIKHNPNPEPGLVTVRGWPPFAILASIIIGNENARTVWNLWKQLPQDEQMRCHIPPFGLRFYQRNIIYLECSLCWRCNNISIATPDGFDTYCFNGSADVSRRLYLLLEQLVPSP